MATTILQPLEDIALFVEVARFGSFTAAAAKLGLPVSSVSRRVARLERGIGLRLLHRTTRRVVTTEVGQAYFDRCSGLVDEVRVAHQDLQALATTPHGRLRVSVTSDFATHFLAPHLVSFRALHPTVAVDLVLTSRRVDLPGESVDVAIRMGPLDDSMLVARRLASLRVGLFASPAYLARRTRPRRPADLGQHDCLSRDADGADTHWTLLRGLRRESVMVAGPFSANGMALLRRLAIVGAGIVALDAALVQADLATGTLEPVLPGWSLGPVPVHALMPSRLMPAKTRVFVDFLAERLATLDVGRRRPGRPAERDRRPVPVAPSPPGTRRRVA